MWKLRKGTRPVGLPRLGRSGQLVSSIRSTVRRHRCGCHARRQSTPAFGSPRKNHIKVRRSKRREMNEIAHGIDCKNHNKSCLVHLSRCSSFYGGPAAYMHLPVRPACTVRLRGWIVRASERGHARCQQNPSYIGAQMLQWFPSMVWEISSRSRVRQPIQLSTPDRNKQKHSTRIQERMWTQQG